MAHYPVYLKTASPQRRGLLARLAAERAALLWQIVGLDEKTLTESPVFDDGAWTARDVLAHVAAWDEVATERIELLLTGREQEVVMFAGAAAEVRNAVFYTARKDWPLQWAVGAFVAARSGFLAVLARLSDDDLHRRLRLPSGETSALVWAEWRARHDAAHAADLVAWWERRGLERGVGPRQILLVGLAAARDELLAAVALVPPEERASRPVCGEWTLKDVLGHVADWEWVGVEGLRHMAAGRSPQVEHIESIDAWNRAHAEARRGKAWEDVGADLHAARDALLEILNGMSQADLARSFIFPWGSEGAAYQWVCVFLAHDREHAEGLQVERAFQSAAGTG